MPCKRYWVSGRVQGVCFRASTQSYAQRLGLSGWVRNMIDGRVEAVASGDQTQLKEFEKWLHSGPDLARVDSVIAIDIDYAKFDSFQIR